MMRTTAVEYRFTTISRLSERKYITPSQCIKHAIVENSNNRIKINDERSRRTRINTIQFPKKIVNFLQIDVKK